MTCPEDDELLLDELGELTVNQRAAVGAHLGTCPACQRRRAALRGALADLGPQAPDGPSADGEAFVARVAAALQRETRPWPRPRLARRPPPRLLWPALGLTAAAAAAVVIAARPAHDVAGTITARGWRGADTTERLAAEVLLVRDGRVAPVAGQAVGPSDAFAVRVTNLSGRTMHLMAFGRDAAGDVHWLYPAYRDARSNPSSVAIADGVKQRMLGEVVQPEEPAAGPLRLVTVVSAAPLTVKDVEARLAQGAAAGEALSALFPGAVTREWAARWEVRP